MRATHYSQARTRAAPRARGTDLCKSSVHGHQDSGATEDGHPREGWSDSGRGGCALAQRKGKWNESPVESEAWRGVIERGVSEHKTCWSDSFRTVDRTTTHTPLPVLTYYCTLFTCLHPVNPSVAGAGLISTRGRCPSIRMHAILDLQVHDFPFACELRFSSANECAPQGGLPSPPAALAAGT